MKILVDAMGGDHAPYEILRGCVEAASEFDAGIEVVGNRETIEKIAAENRLDLSKIGIVHAENVFLMTDPPLSVRSKPDTSLKIGLLRLSEKKADAFVSAGSTGAVQTGANLFVHRINGVERSVIATVLPFETPTLLLDSGANTTYTAELLLQYALMGSIYMRRVCGIERPRVGLLNIGTEPNKGTKEHAKAFELLSNAEHIRFIGNAEPNAVPFGICDVLVCDGFSGNIFLKTVEGMGKFIFSCVKDSFSENAGAKLRGALVRKDLRRVKDRFDPSEHGGAPLLGIAAPVIKAHGNSDARAVKNAIRQAIRCVEGAVCREIADALAPGSAAPNPVEDE